MLGRSLNSVKLKRQRSGIRNRFSNAHQLKPEQVALLGTLPDQELAHRWGRTQKSIEYWRTKLKKPYLVSKCRPWTDQELQLLGKQPDEELAKRFGRTEKAVQSMRVSLGLRQRTTRKWEPRELDMLGRLPDAEVVRITGRTLISVQAMRRTRARAL